MKNTYFSVKPGAKGSEFYGGGNSQGLSDQGTKYQVPSTNYRATSVECPGNHPVITQLSPRNHPLLGSGGQVVTGRGEVLADRRGVLADRRGVVAMMRQKCMMWKYVAMLLAVLVLSVGNVGMAWGETITMSSIFTGENTSATITSPLNATVLTTTKASAAASGKLNSDDNYFEIVLTDKTFSAASINGYINTTDATKNWGFQFTTNGGTTWGSEVTQANDGTKSAHDINVGVTIPSGANGIRIIRRAGTSTYVYSVTLTTSGGAGATTYSVTYNGSGAGGGTVPTDGNSYASGATVTVKGNTGSLTKSMDSNAATFLGWNTNSDTYSGTHYDAGATFSMPASNTTLYAVWGYALSYNTDGGTINDDPYPSYYISIYPDDDPTTVLPTDVTKTGYDFEGWKTGNGSGSIVTAIDGDYTGAFSDDYALKAIWTAKEYTVTLNNQSATSAGTKSVTTTYAANTNLTSAITCPTKTSKVFAGYFTGTNGTGVQLIDPAGNWIASAGGNDTYMDDSKNWKYDNNLTLYACWMEYCPGMDMEAYVTSTLEDGKTSTDFTILGTNKFIYSLTTGSKKTEFDNSNDATGQYDGLKIKSSGDYVMFLVQAGYSLSVKWGYVNSSQPKYSINGGTAQTFTTLTTGSDNSSSPGDIEISSQSYDQLVKIWTTDGNATVLKKITITAPVVATCTDKYSFHYGPEVGDWETPICFEKVGSTHEWNITNFTIPDHTNGQFYVGYAGSTNGQSVTKAWTDSYSESDGVGNGAMLLLPTNGSVVGNAVGATGTLVIWDNSSSKNQYVGFKPDGYSIKYDGVNHPFTETATANKWETDVVTLPDVSSTNYTMEIKTAGGYTTCYHSNAAEAISNMGVTSIDGGLRKIWLYSTASNWIGGDAKMAIWDATHSKWGDDTDAHKFMTKVNDNLWYGFVPDDASTIILVRVNPENSNPAWDWGQSYNIIPGDLNNYITITGTWSNDESDSNKSKAEYTISSTHPATGQKGKFRMWANSNDNNWYVHWIPYYVLSYNANGGSGTTTATERNSESSTPTVTVASNGFTAPEGKHFVNWGTESGGGTTYTEGGSYTLSADATLYAQWAWNTYNVSTSLTNVTVSSGTTGTGAATHGSAYSVTLAGATDYNLPATVTVTIGGETATLTTDYTWDSSTGVLTVLAAKVTGDITITVTGVAAATLTAISADRLYQAAEMANITFTGKDQNFTGLSTNNLFKVYGDATDDTKTAAKGKNENHDVTDDISTKSFTSALYILSNSNTTSTSDPTQGAIEIITPSTAGLLYLYLDADNSSLTLKKQGTSTSTSLSGAAYKAMPVDANTHYFINGSSTGKRGLYGIQYVSTYAVSITPTNVTKATGDTGAGAAIKGKAYTATFTANTSYTLPSDVTVSIGGVTQTKGTGYTWEISGSTATLTVLAAKVTGAIAVTVSGEAAATYTLTTTVGTSEAATSGATITNGVVASIPAGTTVTNNGDNTFTVNTASPTTVTATASVAGVAGPDDDDCTYAFISWENLPATVTADVSNIHALYEARFTIGFKETDGTAVAGISSTYYVYGIGKAVSTFPTPTKSGYTFAGWYKDDALTSSATDLDDEAYGAIDYYAKWTPKTTTITLDKNNSDPGSMDGSATVTYGSKTLASYTAATRTGYTLDKYTDKDGTIIIKANGTLNTGDKGDILQDGAWIYDGSTLTLYAQWEANKYNVTHTLSNVSRSSGDEAGSKKATYGTEYSVVFAAASGYALPVAVTVTVGGSDVTGNCTWNEGTGELTIPAADVTGDIVITVTGVLTCTDPGLGFESPSLTKYTGESVSNTLTNTHNVAVTYSSSDEAVATVNSSTGAVTIKGVGTTTITATAAAQTVSAVSYCADAASYTLTVNPYTITYELDEGAWGGVSHKDTYTKFDEGYDLPTPTKTDKTFLGWYANSGFTGDRVYILPAGSTGNKTYYAKWGSAVTATWAITDNEGGDDAFYKGGGGHHVTVVLDQADWDANGSADDLDISASEGVTLSSVTKGVYTSGDNNGKAYVEADFSISGDIDEDAISFFLNVPATEDYAAAELSKELTLNECPIEGGGSSVDVWYNDIPTGKTNTSRFTFAAAPAGGNNDVQTLTIAGTDYTCAKRSSDWNSTFTFTIDEGKTAYLYFRIKGTNTRTITITNTSNSTSTTIQNIGTTFATYTSESLPAGSYSVSCNGNIHVSIIALQEISDVTSGVPTTLSWSDDLADEAPVGKRDVDADFIYTATPNTNTIGAITYTSSDESVATVDGNGKVHIINEGPTTITATLAESGCYTGAEITYELNVESTCADVQGTIVAADGSAIAGNSIEKGACETVTLKLTGYTDGATIQWKKDGANISGATSAEYIVPEDGAGVYTAVTTNICDLTSNSVTVTSASSTIAPTIFADEFTVKSYRPFEYRLMQLNEGETCTFQSATNWTNDDDFKITTEGNIVTIKGDIEIESDANETITLRISNGCSYIDKDIRIHAIAESIYATPESAKPMIAWIATGDKGVKDNVLADQSTNTALYKALEATGEYLLTPRNCYWTTDETELIKEYSKYDLVILTDYPNSRKGPNSEDDRSKSYTNALGLLIDRVPMLTFEAFVAGCPNWGLSSNPENTGSTQNSLTLLCNANDIFDNTSEAFNAGASVEVGTAAEGQALQGFELDAMPNFVFIAKITDDGTDYVTCCERQVNTNARMMVFGLNQNLMNAITDTGEDMVAGFVDYLLLDETASIPDCSVIFKGTGGTDWSNTGNWEGASLPNPYASVRIDAPCVVGDDETAKAGMIKIHTGSDAGHTYTGSLTIQPQGRMIVENGVYRVEGTNYATYLPTEPNNLVINADAGHTGALIFSNPRGNTQATVYLYSKATTSTSTCWQYVGIPFGSLSPAVSWFYNAWMMKYTTGTTTGDDVLYSWEYINNYDVLNGFQGYALTQTAAKSYQLQGGLAPTTDKVLAVSNAGGKGWNLYANSWTAPIHIDKMEASDFVNADATIYLYNTGSRADWKDLTVDEAGTSTTAGQYLAVPVGLAEYTGTKYIPSMQGFFVQGNHASAAGSVRLRYDAVVRDTTVMADLNTPLRTPSRETVNQEPEHVTMVVRGEKYTDVLHLFRSDEWSAGYENGYDAHKVEGDDYTPQLYAVTGKEELAVVATDEWEGTVLNFRAGSEDVEYTIFFRYNESEAEALYLYDLTTETYTRIENGGSYHFSTTDKETHPRFILTYNAPSVATGTGDVQRDDVQSTKARKVLLDNHVYIFRNGNLYDSTGKMVK